MSYFIMNGSDVIGHHPLRFKTKSACIAKAKEYAKSFPRHTYTICEATLDINLTPIPSDPFTYKDAQS